MSKHYQLYLVTLSKPLEDGGSRSLEMTTDLLPQRRWLTALPFGFERLSGGHDHFRIFTADWHATVTCKKTSATCRSKKERRMVLFYQQAGPTPN